MIALAFLHALVLAVAPVWPVIALGVWWNSNTISHNFIHRPFFREPWRNRLFSAYLSVLLGIPQSLWRERHLAHHAGTHWRAKVTPRIAFESALVLTLWTALLLAAPRFFLTAYFPGYVLGLALCAMQGRYEHVRGAVSHYGPVYNFLCFNDGYHAEHHAYPGVSWRALPSRKLPNSVSSAWPAPLRWLEDIGLEGLERLVLRSKALQRFVLSRHRQAIAALLPPGAQRVIVIGGGLFPRTALILRELLPNARIKIIDADLSHIETARRFINHVDFEQRHYFGEPLDCDLAVIPLCFDGDRQALYRNPPAPVLLIHDWIWRSRGIGRIASPLLLKRINRACTP